MLDAINRAVNRHKGRIDKIAFAKALTELCKAPGAQMQPHVDSFLDRMQVIFRAVNEAVRRATDDAANKKLETLVAERAALFKVDNPNHATREQASIALRQIEAQLDDTPEAEAIRNAMVPLRRDHHLHEEPAKRIDDYQTFTEQLDGLKHAWRAQLNAPRQVSEPAKRSTLTPGAKAQGTSPQKPRVKKAVSAKPQRRRSAGPDG